MKKPRVVAFLARAGHGKTTAATHLVDHHGAYIVSFAGPLKRLVKLLITEWGDDHVYGPTHIKEEVDSRLGFSPTQFMQRLGEGARVELGRKVWVDAALNEIHKVYQEDPTKDLFVIDDARYINEAEALSTDSSIIGHVIKLVCPDAQSKRDPNHPSEAQVDQIPPQYISQTIISARSPESSDLKAKVDEAFKVLFPE